jgi:hypothetical protein
MLPEAGVKKGQARHEDASEECILRDLAAKPLGAMTSRVVVEKRPSAV